MNDDSAVDDELRAALRRVIANGEADARVRRESGSPGTARTDLWAVAEACAESADVRRVTELARKAADRTGYGRRANAPDVAGRPFDAAAIHSTGLAGAILAGQSVSDDTIEELAGYLAGPAVPIVRLLGIDADLSLSSPLDVDGWELFVADEADLRGMLPVPSLAEYQPRRPWDPDRWAGTAFFRQVVNAPPITGIGFAWPQAYPEWEVWRPLLVLALVSADVVTMWSDHQVEPGRHVLTRLDRVWYDTVGGWDDGSDLLEIPFRATVNIDPPEEPAFRQQMNEVSALLPNEPLPPTTNRQRSAQMPYTRLKLAAQRLLAAGEHAAGQPTPHDPVHATEAMLHYVVALEALFGEDTKDGEITRKIAQRTAVAVGRDDDERLVIAKKIREVYAARSTVLHGGAEPSASDVDALRGIVRRAILARLVHGDPPSGYDSLVQFFDHALLSSRALAALREPLQRFDDVVLLGAGKDHGWQSRREAAGEP